MGDGKERIVTGMLIKVKNSRHADYVPRVFMKFNDAVGAHCVHLGDEAKFADNKPYQLDYWEYYKFIEPITKCPTCGQDILTKIQDGSLYVVDGKLKYFRGDRPILVGKGEEVHFIDEFKKGELVEVSDDQYHWHRALYFDTVSGAFPHSCVEREDLKKNWLLEGVQVR